MTLTFDVTISAIFYVLAVLSLIRMVFCMLQKSDCTDRNEIPKINTIFYRAVICTFGFATCGFKCSIIQL